MKAANAIGIVVGIAALAYLFSRSREKRQEVQPVDTIKVNNKMQFLKRSQPIEGIVIHHTATSSPSSTKSVLESRGYSTNFEVDRDGKIYEYADPAMWEAQATGGGANSHTIGIDVTHYGNQEFTQPQMDSLRKLVHALADRFKFPVVVAPDNDRREWKNWKGSGFTVFRHRNFLNTECPSTLPMEKLA